MAKVKNGYVDVICTEFVTDNGGYKMKKAEYPKRFPQQEWNRISKNQYANKEFRIMTPEEVQQYRGVKVVTKPIDNTDEVEKLKAEIERLKGRKEPSEPGEFIPKSHKEILMMKKQDLVDYCVAKHNTDVGLYEGMTNKELQIEAEK